VLNVFKDVRNTTYQSQLTLRLLTYYVLNVYYVISNKLSAVSSQFYSHYKKKTHVMPNALIELAK